jgi:hypothetical protein
MRLSTLAAAAVVGLGFVTAAHAERLIDQPLVDAAWLAKKPKWARYEHHPVSFAAVWRRS